MITSDNERFQAAIDRIDAANGADPRRIVFQGRECPFELLYAERMTHWLEQLAPDASEVLQLAARSQHICRWEIPRGDFPLDRARLLSLADYALRVPCQKGRSDPSRGRVRRNNRRSRRAAFAEEESQDRSGDAASGGRDLPGVLRALLCRFLQGTRAGQGREHLAEDVGQNVSPRTVCRATTRNAARGPTIVGAGAGRLVGCGRAQRRPTVVWSLMVGLRCARRHPTEPTTSKLWAIEARRASEAFIRRRPRLRVGLRCCELVPPICHRRRTTFTPPPFSISARPASSGQ